MADSLERFRALVEKSPDALSLVDGEGTVLYATASTGAVLGYPPEELLGRNGLDLLHPLDRDHCAQTLKRVLEEPRCPSQIQIRVRQKSGQWRWVESTASNLLDEPHVGAIVINYREIGTRRAEEEERQRLTDELFRSNAELQAFAHTVAHDLNQSLSTISGFTELLVGRAELKEADQKLADFIVAGVLRMSTLLDHLLSSSACGYRGSLQAVNLEHAAALAMQNLSAALSSCKATIKLGRLPTVLGNECDLIRVFQNLISNAVKYRSETAIEVDINAERLGPDWVIRVHDNGIGIPKEQHRRVFGRFTRVHDGEEIPGSGLGLAICKKIVEGLGGAIWVESEPGVGSTLCFTVAAEQEQLATATGPESHHRPAYAACAAE